MTTAETLARFTTEYLVPRSISAERQVRQLRELTLLGEWLAGRPDPKPLTELNQQDVLTYLGEKLTRGLNPNSVRTHYMMLRSFVAWATAAGLIDAERANMIRLIGTPRGSTARGVPNPYKPTEIKAFRALVAEKYPLLPEYGRGSRLLVRYLQGRRDRLHAGLWRHARRLQFEAQIALALELGLRSIEIQSLSIEAAHYENDALVVKTAKQGPGTVKYREIPWTPHAHSVMLDWIDFRNTINPPHEGLWLVLFQSPPDFDQLDPQTLSGFHRTLRVFGPGWRWHRFRHTAATEWLRAKMPLEKVQVMMGHARLEQTLEYTKIVRSDISDAMADAGPEFARRMGLAA